MKVTTLEINSCNLKSALDQDKKDPLSKMMKDAGFYCEDDIMKPTHQWVFSFPQKSPETAITRTEMSAIKQLETWNLLKKELKKKRYFICEIKDLKKKISYG